jgi:hypothetical protein
MRKSPFIPNEQELSRLSLLPSNMNLKTNESRLKQSSLQSLNQGAQSIATSEKNYFGNAPDMNTL